MSRIKPIFLGIAVFMSLSVHAELRPIDDEAMSEVTGQGFISIDRTFSPIAGDNTSFTRINFGANIDIQTNINKLELGRYDRDDRATGGELEKAGSSDVLIDNLSLGFINNQQFFQKNPDNPRMLKADGSAFGENEIVPFRITDPFAEFAFDEQTNELLGMRIGFGGAEGILSGNIRNLTGNVNVDILDKGEGLKNADSNGNLFDQLVSFLTPVLAGGSPLQAKAQLVHGDPNDPATLGSLDPVRATHIGVPDGEAFLLEDVNGLVGAVIKLIAPTLSSEITADCSGFLGLGGCDVRVVAQDCELLGITACFPLTNFESFAIGQLGTVGGKRTLTGPSSGLFLSFQTKDLNWLKDVAKSNPKPEDFIKATAGAFFNIPNGAATVNLNQALNGIDRYRSEFIDRGVGMF